MLPRGGALDRPREPCSLVRLLRRDAEAPARAPGEPRWQGFIYVLPAAFLFTALVILPFGDGIWISFFNWDGVSPSKWAGLANYRALFSDPIVAQAFAHAGVLIIFYALLPLVIGLFVASSLNRIVIRGGGTIRAVLFLPQVVAPVVVGVSWRWIFDQNGPVNSFLQA